MVQQSNLLDQRWPTNLNYKKVFRHSECRTWIRKSKQSKQVVNWKSIIGTFQLYLCYQLCKKLQKHSIKIKNASKYFIALGFNSIAWPIIFSVIIKIKVSATFFYHSKKWNLSHFYMHLSMNIIRDRYGQVAVFFTQVYQA